MEQFGIETKRLARYPPNGRTAWHILLAASISMGDPIEYNKWAAVLATLTVV